MAVKINSLNVDDKFSSIVEPNLYADQVIVPGVTCTEKYSLGPAGQIMVHKLTKGDNIAPGKPGVDFSDDAVADTLITIALNNAYRKSTKIYNVQKSQVAFAVAEERLADTLSMTKEARQYSALACMANEGTASSNTATTTKDTSVENLIAVRKEIKDNHGQANFALVSTEIYSFLLQRLGFNETTDSAIVSGALIKRFGLNVIECNSFDLATAKYYDYTATEKTVDLTDVEMIVGYNEAFSALDNIEMLRLIDSENFNGVKAQVEYVSGFRVNSPEQVIIKKKATV